VTLIFLFDVTLVIYELVFGLQQVARGFWFLGLLFCGVGVVYCLFGHCFVFVGNLRYIGHSFLGKVKNWGSIPSQAHSCFYFIFCLHMT